MPDSDPSAHALDVPGARLYYERRDTGPLLLMIGSPMDSTGFAGLASALAGDHTVVTYDPRCIGNSSREDTSQDVTPDQQADDVHRLLSALGCAPPTRRSLNTCSGRPRTTGPTSRRSGRRRRGSWSPAGPRPPGRSRTARPWHSPTSSAPPRSTSPVTTSVS